MPGCVLAAAVLGSGVPGADEKRVAQVMGAIADRVTDQFVNPYTFPSSHKRILEPYNYYEFGQVTSATPYIEDTPQRRKVFALLHAMVRACAWLYEPFARSWEVACANAKCSFAPCAFPGST